MSTPWPAHEDEEPTPLFFAIISPKEKPVATTDPANDDTTTQPISGYRQLSEQEIDVINTNKGFENDLGRWLKQLQADVEGVDGRWVSIARTHFQEGFMALNRAVARPESEL